MFRRPRRSTRAYTRIPSTSRGRSAGGGPAGAAAGLHLAVELVHQRGDRQAGAVGLGFGQADAEILAHPVDREAEIELALAHGGAPVVHLPGLRGAFADDLAHLGHVEARHLAEVRSEEHTSELTSIMRISYAVLRL